MIVSVLLWIIVHTQIGYIYAPELIQGSLVSIYVRNAHAGYIDGGNWQALQLGKIHGMTEKGIIFPMSGETIDDDGDSVLYRISYRSNGKYIGEIDFRGHWRKLCGAARKSALPCK